MYESEKDTYELLIDNLSHNLLNKLSTKLFEILDDLDYIDVDVKISSLSSV
jgi:hypothetical protein